VRVLSTRNSEVVLDGTERIDIGGVSVPAGHLIGGARVGSTADYEVITPIDGSPLGRIPAGGHDEATAAVTAAADAFPAWAALGPHGRGEILDRFADAIVARLPDFQKVDTYDHGALAAARPSHGMPRTAWNIKFFADWARQLHPESIPGDVVDNSVHYDPAGVAALIVPWNAPLMLGTWKIGPALAAGNTAVVKPPEFAPFSLSLLGEVAQEAGVPDGVLNVLHGTGASAGDALVRDARVGRISFTGSPATARVIGAAAADTLTPVSFELGGKSPFVICADADLTSAARTVAVQFMNAGQVCLAGTRLLVEASVVDELLPLVLAEVDRLVVGDPRSPETRVGPLIHPSHFAKVQGLVERAIAGGARVLCGGAPHAQGGLYFEPTILTDVDQRSEIVQTEVFGPVLTLQTWTGEDELVELANDTVYGLAATLFSGDAARAERIAARLVAGTVWVNCFYVRDLAAPFGGSRQSGIGREGGTWSFDFFCDVKNVATRRGSFSA
jgi:acyl-CoA reductase-like NAD-dependent aldehyde dehydrogenase